MTNFQSLMKAAPAIAEDLDSAYAAVARVGQRLGRLDPTAGTLDRALIDALTGLQEARRHLDRLAVAAGGTAAHAFVRRDLRPRSATRLAAGEAARQERAHQLALQVERERRDAANGRAGWAARCGE